MKFALLSSDYIMIVKFVLGDSLCDCSLQITDTKGTRDFFLISPSINHFHTQYLDVEIYDTDFDLAIIPMSVNFNSIDNSSHSNTWIDRFMKNTATKIFSLAENTILRVGCKYRICGVKHNDVITINPQQYIFGTFDRYDLFGLFPMTYMFLEVFSGNNKVSLIDAFEINRNEVIKTARKIILADFGLKLIFTYPFQVSRVKRLSKNKKVFKTLHKFHCMPFEQKHKLINKFKKFTDS